MSHIATSETFMHGAEPHWDTCSVCGEEANIRMGWLDFHCDACGRYYSPERAGEMVRFRRETLGFDRPAMARIAGLKKSTIAHYETYWPSERYWDLTRGLIDENS